jgi:hypothetical protein
MSAAASGRSIKYKVINPTQKDLGALIPGVRTAQKYREAISDGAGYGNTGIVYGSNTNLGTRWWIHGYDYFNRIVAYPLNGRDALGQRNMPQFRIDSTFNRDINQPGKI